MERTLGFGQHLVGELSRWNGCINTQRTNKKSPASELAGDS